MTLRDVPIAFTSTEILHAKAIDGRIFADTALSEVACFLDDRHPVYPVMSVYYTKWTEKQKP